MIEARRRAYLEAMGFDVWVARSAAQPPTQSMLQALSQSGLLVVGPGQGSTLLVCAAAAQTAGKFAADLSRALGGDPAWAWPDRGGPGGGTGDGGGESLRLEAAIGARLFTRVVIFGADTARWLFEQAVPEVVASAVVSTLDDLEELAVSSAAKRALWQRLQNPSRGGSVPDAA